MKQFAVVGHPLHHSLSPTMFRAAFESIGLDAMYVKKDIGPEELSVIVENLRSGSYEGLSVTVPYKEGVMSLVDICSDEAVRIGAVNTLYRSGGRVIGSNTDWSGFLRTLTEEINPDNKKILLYGAGGAARACLFALQEWKDNVFLTNRTKEKGERLAVEFGVTFVEADSLPAADIFVNATSVGLHSDAKLLVPEEWLKNVDLVFDLLYGETLLSQVADRLGVKTIDGRKMLVYQAAEQFTLFVGTEAPLQVMAESVGLELF